MVYSIVYSIKGGGWGWGAVRCGVDMDVSVMLIPGIG